MNIIRSKKVVPENNKRFVNEDFRFKIFGERNSGTSLIRYLLPTEILFKDDLPFTRSDRVNTWLAYVGTKVPTIYDNLYDISTKNDMKNILGWKHAIPDIELLRSARAVPIFIVKHPKFWLASFGRRPFHHYKGGDDYLPRRIENMPRLPIPLHRLIMTKMKAYRDVILSSGGVLIQYETLISNFSQAHPTMIQIFGSCSDLPKYDVRPFVDYIEKNYINIHSNETLHSLPSPSDEIIEELDILEFFGYSLNSWSQKFPLFMK
jgi:hypothetical protein